jgi:hypothetical protein
LNTITITGNNFGNNPIVTVGNSSQVYSNAGIASQVSIYPTFQIPATAAGTSLPVTVTSTGEFGNAFFQNPQNVSQMQSNTFYIQVTAASSNVTLQVQSNGSTISPGACANIAPTTPTWPYGPVMPQITATIASTNGSAVTGNATWQMKTTFNRLTEPGPASVADATFTPSAPVTVAANQTWTAPFSNFGLIPFGGRSEIDWTYNGQTQPGFVFQICGQNPTPTVVGNYFSTAVSSSGTSFWFANNISIHETAQQQFYAANTASSCQGTDSSQSNNIGMPLCGRPAGYGLMQLDPSSSIQAWNWQQNINGGMNLLNTIATSAGNSFGYTFWSRQVMQWQQYNQVPQNAANPVPPPSSEVFPDPSDPNQFASCTFSLSQSAPYGDLQTAYTAPTYWYGDAVLMRNYAGGNPNYIYWNSSNGNTTTGAWGKTRGTLIIANGIKVLHNNPYEFCSCSTMATCQHTTPTNLWYVSNQ